MSSPELQRLEELLLGWEANELSESETEELRTILRRSDVARSRYARWQMLSSAMHLESAAGLPQATAVGATDSQAIHTSRRKHSTRWWWIAAGLLVAAMATRLVFLEASRGGRTGSLAANVAEQKSQGVAVITELVDTTWTEGAVSHEPGEALLPGEFAIASGYAQIEFFCGATVILEGPAALELKSTTLAALKSGRLRAQVPPAARGFTIDTGDMQLVDLGTEFGLSVSDEGAQVHVFEGEVELQESGQEKKRLTEGQSIARSADGLYETADAAADGFTDVDQLRARIQTRKAQAYGRWKGWADSVRADPRLITFYTFENASVRDRRLLSNLSPGQSDLDGAIVGASRTRGRWSDKAALEFKRPADRVRVQIPGEFSSLTFAAWVRIDSLDRQYNSLFLTDNYNRGEPHWQILASGQVYFSVRPTERGQEGPSDFKALSKPFWNPSLGGQWIHIATTYDVASRMVRHYLNGKQLDQLQLPAEQVVETTRIGKASIGNWSAPTQPHEEFAIRNLNGRIDEVILFSEALTSQEIATIYEVGKP